MHCVFVCVCLYILVFVHVCGVCVCLFVCVCKHVHVWLCVWLHVCEHACVYAVCACVFVCAFVFIFAVCFCVVHVRVPVYGIYACDVHEFVCGFVTNNTYTCITVQFNVQQTIPFM